MRAEPPAAPARGGAEQPLAVRMRPRALDEVVGQGHLLGPGTPIRQLVDRDVPMSLVLWGPPGTGKTTLATVVSHVTSRRFVEVSAVSDGVKRVRAEIDLARRELGMTGRQTVLFVDEVHRFNKAQQDALLPAVENRWVSFIGATTENPFFSVISPLLSRSLLLTLEPLGEDDLREVVRRALTEERGLNGAVTLDPAAEDHLIRLAGGDARRTLTYLEAAALVVDDGGVIDADVLEKAVDRAAVRYDREGDQHYDVISAFIKSIRGSDVDAALHYLARMIEAGEDARFIARRLIVHASEDVGMADPTALQTAVAAAQAVEFVGLPEARINLAQAVIHLSLAPKSNAVITAVDGALGDVRKGSPGLCRATCAMPTTRAPRRSATGRATGTRTTTPAAWSASSTRPTRSTDGSTIARPGTARKPGSPRCSRGSDPSCAAPRTGGDRSSPAVAPAKRRGGPVRSVRPCPAPCRPHANGKP